MNIFLEKANCKVSTRIPAKVKDKIITICTRLEMSESKFFKMAIQNQILASQSNESAPTLNPAQP